MISHYNTDLKRGVSRLQIMAVRKLTPGTCNIGNEKEISKRRNLDAPLFDGLAQCVHLQRQEFSQIVTIHDGPAGLFPHVAQMTSIFQRFNDAARNGLGRPKIGHENVVPVSGHLPHGLRV